MAVLERIDLPVATHLTTTARVLAVATAAGLALGIGDLWATTHLPYPWADLADSSAVWALGAFVLGAGIGAGPVGPGVSASATSATAALGGVVMMLVAVESYYGFATAFDLSGLASPWSAHARMWLEFGVVAGIVFGTAGCWTSCGTWGLRVLGAATGAGVLVGEALHTERALIADPLGVAGTGGVDLLGIAVLMSALGVIVLGLSSRSPRVMIPAALLAMPMAVLSAVAFSATGIAY